MSLLELYRLAEVEAGKAASMMLFPIGDWSAADYPKLSLTQELADAVMANFSADVLRTKVPVESVGRHDVTSPAAGWFERLYMAPFEWQGLAGEALYGDWVPNKRGAQLVNDGEYAYNSVEIATHKDPVTGTETPHVLKAVALTNRPVLRMMPAVAEAAESIIQLSELTRLTEDDPVTTILDDMDALATKLDEALKGKKGMPAIRTMLREARSKASAHKLAEDSYNELREALESALAAGVGEHLWIADFSDEWAIYEESSLGGPFRLWRVAYVRDESGITFGVPQEVERHTDYVPKSPSLSEPAIDATAELLGSGASGPGVGQSPPRKEKEQMSKLTEVLKLAEGADESLILAEVTKVTTERDTLAAKLAEGEKAERVRRLDESINGKHILPAERDAYVALAESAPATFEASLTARNAAKPLIDTGEHGSGKAPNEPDPNKNASVELAEKTVARQKAEKISYSEAQALVLSEDAALRERYDDYRAEIAMSARKED